MQEEQELFILGDDYMVILNRTWISTIKEYAKILKRDKDRFKKQAQKEFTFIYHYCDWRSNYINFSDADRYKEAVRNALLDETFNLEKDQDLLEAVKEYERRRTTRSLRIVKQAYKAIDALGNYFDSVVVGNSKQALDVKNSVTGLAKMLSEIKGLEEQVKVELKQEAGIRGDQTKGITEDPDEEDMNFN